MSIALRVVATASLLLLGCAPSGDDPSSRLATWEAPDGSYRILYLTPPWDLVDEDAPSFRIASNANSAGGIDGGPGKYELHVTTIRGDVASLMEAEVRTAMSSGETIIEGPRVVETSDGTAGQELLTFEATLPIEFYRRTVFFPLPSGRVLRLGFVATPDLGTLEVDAMINHVGIGPVP